METKIIDIQVIIKFRDNFIFEEDTLIKHFKIDNPVDYLFESKSLIQLQNVNSFVITEGHPIVELLSNLSNQGLEINYLFDTHHSYNIFNNLYSKCDFSDNKKTSGLTELPFPNFYNYFVINFSKENFSQDEEKMYSDVLMNWMFKLNQYVRDERIETENQVLDYIYLKGQPSLADSAGLSSSGEYFLQMNVPNVPIAVGGKNIIGGEGVSIFDIEEDWILTNSEIPITTSTIEQIFPESTERVNGDKIHGAKVLEVLRANISNGNAIKGLAPNSYVYLSSMTFEITGSTKIISHSEENSLLAALFRKNPGSTTTTQIKKGSIIMMPIYLPPVPIDIQPAVWQLIKVATDHLGVVVIESAGNAGIDLNALPSTISITQGDPNLINNLFEYYQNLLKNAIVKGFSSSRFISSWINNQPELINYYLENDSGCILVGGYKKIGTTFIKHGDSNFDSRSTTLGKGKVKVFGIASGLWTTLGTSGFGYTSAACAVIAGVAALLQSYVKAKPAGAKFINAAKMLDLLITTSSTDVKFNGNKIGKVPNVNKAINKINNMGFYNSLPIL